MKAFICYAFLLSIAATSGFGQDVPQSQTNEGTPENEVSLGLKIASNLVVVRVVVRDKQGKPVGNLTKNDFRLFDRGKEQSISQFEAENGIQHLSSASGISVSENSTPLRSTSPPKFIAFYFDDLNTPDADLIYARDAADQYLTANIQTQGSVAIFTSGQMLSDFTSNPQQIHDALLNLHASAQALSEHHCPDLSDYQALRITENDEAALSVAIDEAAHCDMGMLEKSPRDFLETLIRKLAQNVVNQAQIQTRTNLQQLARAVTSVSQKSGQRTLILVSPGFLSEYEQHRVDEIVNQALHAQVVINALDAKGLAVLMRSADSSRSYIPAVRPDMLQEANAEINRAWARSASVRDFFRNYPGAQLRYYSVPLKKGETDPVRSEVLALMLAAGLILLVACANLAGLTLVRLLHRRSEFAMRVALGASSWQIQRQLWIENLLLALVGAFAAVAVGFLSLRGLLRIMPEHFLPIASVHFDSHVLGFTLLVSLLTSVLFGMLPALSCRRIDLRSAIASHAVIGTRNVSVRQALIAGEVALTIVLLSAAGLLIRTLVHLETLPPGFNPVGLITAQASLDDVRYHDPEAFRKLLDESTANMRQIPGVQDAAVALSLPYQRAAIVVGIVLADGPQAGKSIAADELYVTPTYFDALQIHRLMGRAFSDADGPHSQHVIIVNQTFANKFFPGENPVGRYLEDHQNDRLMIIGVVGNTVLTSKLYEGSAPLKDEETIYLPATQVAARQLAVLHAWFQPSWIVRAARVEGLNAQMQKALAAADPDLPFSGFHSMNDLRATTLTIQRIEVALLAAMASLALLLSGVGIFALVANTVVQRRREIGIRIALGSTIARAMVHIARSGVSASAVGLVLGLLLCAGILRGMRSVIYGVGVYDGPTILVVVLTVFVATLFATVLPSLKVADTNPAATLRDE